VDSYQTRIGIRTIEFTKAEGFKINGQILKFRGANREQDYPYIGYAMGNSGQYRDAYKLKEAGFQYVRTSASRPQDPVFLEACDELGLMVLNPIPGCQFIGGTTFKERSYQTMRDLIRRDRNHPCVIAWELSLNETWWTDPNYTPMAMSIGHSEYPGSQCYIAGWKDGGMWGEPALYDIFIATPSAGARTYDGPLPLIVSEHGHWEYGGLGSTSDVHRGDGEAAMLQQAWNHQESHHLNRGLPNMCGDGVWVGMDYMTYPSGVMDKFRLPKFSYYFWQSQRDPNLIIPGVNSGPMVYIANYWTSTSPNDVNVYSNCEQVKLYINSVLQGTHTPNTGYPNSNLLHPPFSFSGLTWVAGSELKAEGYLYINGQWQLVATHIVRTPDSAASLDISFDLSELKAGGDITFVYVSVLDANGTVVPNASNWISLDIVSGPATLASPNQVQAEAGIATFLLRSTTEPGLITVQATASTLGSVTASIVNR
jgi:beta-galactosidase